MCRLDPPVGRVESKYWVTGALSFVQVFSSDPGKPGVRSLGPNVRK